MNFRDPHVSADESVFQCPGDYQCSQIDAINLICFTNLLLCSISKQHFHIIQHLSSRRKLAGFRILIVDFENLNIEQARMAQVDSDYTNRPMLAHDFHLCRYRRKLDDHY